MRIPTSITESKLFVRQEILASVCFLLVATYWPTLLLIGFAIPIRELEMRNFRRYMIKSLMIVGSAVVAFAIWSAVISTNMSSTQMPGINSSGQVHYLATHFWLIPVIVLNSFWSNGIIWAKAAIGVLGWGTLYFHWFFYLVFVIVLVELFKRIINWGDLLRLSTVIGAVISLATFIGFILLMYVVATPVGACSVAQEFLQGRYFHPLFLFLAVMAYSPDLETTFTQPKSKLFNTENFLLAFFVIVTWVVLTTLRWRYWRI